MKETYTVKYRQPGQWFWRTIKGVWRDEVCYGPRDAEELKTKIFTGPPLYRAFTNDKDRIRYVSLHAEVEFLEDRQEVYLNQMSKRAGTPVMRG